MAEKKFDPPKPTNLGGSYVRGKDGSISPNLKDHAMKARADAKGKKEAEAKTAGKETPLKEVKGNA